MPDALARWPLDVDLALARVRGHWRRGHREGFRPLLRSDLTRGCDALRSYRWALTHQLAPNAVPVFILGIQRSGTDMLVEAFRKSPEIDVHNENANSKAFQQFKLREDAILRALIVKSNHRCIAFKSLCDSHRVVHLLEGLGTPSKGRAVWIYRSMEGRVRSTLGRWPDNNLRVLREVVEQGSEDRWEAGGLPSDKLDLIRSFDYEEMTRESAAALLWYVRNELYFDLGLNRRRDVVLLSYEQTLADPEGTIRSLCDFLGVSYSERMSGHIGERPAVSTQPLEIDPLIRARCADLEDRLAASVAGVQASLAGSLSV